MVLAMLPFDYLKCNDGSIEHRNKDITLKYNVMQGSDSATNS